MFRRSPFPWKVYKKDKKSFFIDQFKTPTPKDSEIAGEIVENMILSSQFSNKEELEKLLDLPFFKSKLHNKEYFYERFSVKTQSSIPLFSKKDLEKAENIRKVKDELKEEVLEEVIEEKKSAIREWEEKLAEKANKYFSFPSILDGKEYPLPEINEKKLTETIYSPWWEKIGLIKDPFLPLDGISTRDRDLLEKIVLKTEIFKKYCSILENSIYELYKNIVVYGDYGSGKTTFFDFLNPELFERKVIPLYIQLGGEFEVRENIYEFRKRVITELRKLYPIFTEENLPQIETMKEEQAIIALMTKLSFKGAKGFVIFIDDLHKGKIPKALRFMSYLQILSSQLRRGTDLNIGFFVAGATEWEDKITNSSKFSGSIDKQERMPQLKPEVALEAINKRLKAFAKNPENPKQIEMLFITRIYRTLRHYSRKITFRSVMREVINEFEASHFTGLSTNPLKIEDSVLQQIRDSFEENSGAFIQLQKILFSKSLNPLQRKHCLELLIKIYVYNGLRESDIKRPDVPFLQRLNKAGLIIKVIDDPLLWKVSRKLYEVNKKIIKEQNLSMEDYLLKLYPDQIPEEEKKRISRSQDIIIIDHLLTFMKRRLGYLILKDAKACHKQILASKRKYANLKEEPKIIIRKCNESLSKLTKAYMLFEKLRVLESSPKNNFRILNFWTDFWWSPEPINQYLRAVNSQIKPKRKIPLVLAFYRESFSQILDFFRNEFENSRIFHIPIINLKNEEIKLLHECRVLWMKNKFWEMLDLLVTNVERKLRTFLYDLFTIFFGNFEQRIRILDSETRNYIIKNKQKDITSGFSVSQNEFQQLNRGQYKNILTGEKGISEGKRNWNHIFSKVFKNWSEKDLYAYLDIFADFNKKISHLKEESISNSEQDLVYAFMQKTTRFFININKCYLDLIRNNYFVYKEEKVIFSLNSYNDKNIVNPINIDLEEIRKIIQIISDKGILRLPLDDQEYVEGFFELDYRKVISIFAILINGLDVESNGIKTKLDIIDFKGNEIKIQIIKSQHTFTSVN